MRIVQVIDQLGTGGAERVCVNLANLFARNGYQVLLIVFDKKGSLFSLIDDNVEVVILNKEQNKLKAYRQIVNLFQPDDIIHAHVRKTYRFIQKAFLMFGKRKKVILHDHYGRISVDKKVPMFYKTLFKPNMYIGCSSLLTEWAIDKLKLNRKRVFLINNFVLTHQSEKSHKQGKGLVLVANLKEVKNHAFAIRLAHLLGKKLTIYCSDTYRGGYWSELTQLLEELDYTNQVEFITGCSNVQAELKRYEMGILTSFSEGDPLVIMEYLAQGLPCLVSNVGESVKLIKEKFPFMVQDDFDLEKWKKAYYKVKNIKQEEIEHLYASCFAENLFLQRYLDVYNALKEG